jgi:hypothetical protein
VTLPTAPLPPGDLRRIYLHWTGGDYATVFPAYHFCVALGSDGVPYVVPTHDLRENMRDVRVGLDLQYAAHTAGRNSFSIGLAVCGMRDATPNDFGRYPLRDDLIARCCALAARLCAYYAIPVEPRNVRTHAEAAVDDGYFGCGPDERWDIARLAPSDAPLEASEARATGDLLRARIRAS